MAAVNSFSFEVNPFRTGVTPFRSGVNEIRSEMNEFGFPVNPFIAGMNGFSPEVNELTRVKNRHRDAVNAGGVADILISCGPSGPRQPTSHTHAIRSKLPDSQHAR